MANNKVKYMVFDTENGTFSEFDSNEEAKDHIQNEYDDQDDLDNVIVVKGKQLIFHEERSKLKITIDE